jgi:hypothetical protein
VTQTSQWGIMASWAHQKFAAVYHQTGDRVLAAKECGSKAKGLYQAGSILLTRTGVMAELERLKGLTDERVVQSAAETKAEVNGLINEAIGIARLGSPILRRDGSPLTDDLGGIIHKPDTAGILKGAELKGKTVAMFTDKQQITGEMEGKSDTELGLIVEAALSSNPMVLEQVASLDIIKDKVQDLARRHAAACEGAEGEGTAEAGRLSPSPEAGDSPSRGLH